MAFPILVAALLVHAAPDALAAAPASQPKAVAQGKKKKSSDGTVCRRVVPTGSIMAIRSCRTQRDWDALTAGGQDTLRQTKDHQSTMGGIPLP
jgi:hypothetical protein